MFLSKAVESSKRMCQQQQDKRSKKLCLDQRIEGEITMDNLPRHMIHLGDGLFVVVNSFQMETRVHIRVYVTDDNGFLHPTKEGVSLKPERLFHRKDNSFHLVPERVIIRGAQFEHLLDSQNQIFNCVKTSLIEYTLKERVIFEIRKYPYDEELDDWDADTPQGYDELVTSLSSFTGLNALRRALGNSVKPKQNKKWLKAKESYTLHRAARRNFKRNRVIVGGIDEQFQADLLDMHSLSFYPHVVEGVEERSFVADPQAAFPVFYVYSDIVQPVVVGHVEAPLLRVVQVDVSLNDRLVSNSSNTYPVRSYIEKLLNHGYDNKTSKLTSEMFHSDNDNGLEKRSKFFESSDTVDMIGGLHSDLFHQEDYSGT
ncbi:hypothetical protein HNY73_009473 [Argiope bruennichi]|uniref:Transcriptional coactivator p15 (PC4) C-terminal domain-containing protein n=1 Tax=Argiope bruennichi TaxID=94029 RepID=A0A8T0FC73_ARGBR|nr:hypothetical protein HNY73_009473 [Argiope bruennichi]